MLIYGQVGECAEIMRRIAFDNDEYYKRAFCQKCKGLLVQKDRKRCKKEKFLLLCEKCYPEIKAALAKCLPLFQKFKGM